MNRIALLLSLVATAIPALAQDSCRAQSEYDEIVSAVTEGFYDKTFSGLDWPSRVTHYRTSVSCNADAERVARVINKLLDELKASHLGVYTRNDFHYWGLNSLFSPDNTRYSLNFAGLWPERRGGRWHAKYVFEGSAAARAGIAQGDELIRLNGAVFDPFSFTGQHDSVVFSSKRGKRQTVSLRAEHISVMQAFVDASRASSRIFDAEGRRVGYFHLWGARDGVLKALEDSLAEFATSRVDALILDFRGGYGGTSLDYLKALLASQYLMNIPKFVLIDDGVRSGKEMLAAIMKRDKLATLVGSRTAGAFLGATPVRFFDDRYFLLLAAFGGAPQGMPPVEGVGVSPDVEVPPCRQHCAGQDPQLKRALDLVITLEDDACATASPARTHERCGTTSLR
jgi:carboxyl-terminal processing protease